MTEKSYPGDPRGFFVGAPVFDLFEHFSDIVAENYAKFMEDTSNKRNMFNAIVSLYHFHEIIWHNSEEIRNLHGEISKFREYVRTQSPLFDHAEAICVYYKHATATRPRVTNLVASIVDVSVLSAEIHGNMSPEEGHPNMVWGIDVTKPFKANVELQVRLTDGQTIKTSDIATALNEVWGAILCEIEGN